MKIILSIVIIVLMLLGLLVLGLLAIKIIRSPDSNSVQEKKANTQENQLDISQDTIYETSKTDTPISGEKNDE